MYSLSLGSIITRTNGLKAIGSKAIYKHFAHLSVPEVLQLGEFLPLLSTPRNLM